MLVQFMFSVFPFLWLHVLEETARVANAADLGTSDSETVEAAVSFALDRMGTHIACLPGGFCTVATVPEFVAVKIAAAGATVATDASLVSAPWPSFVGIAQLADGQDSPSGSNPISTDRRGDASR